MTLNLDFLRQSLKQNKETIDRMTKVTEKPDTLYFFALSESEQAALANADDDFLNQHGLVSIHQSFEQKHSSSSLHLYLIQFAHLPEDRKIVRQHLRHERNRGFFDEDSTLSIQQTVDGFTIINQQDRRLITLLSKHRTELVKDIERYLRSAFPQAFEFRHAPPTPNISLTSESYLHEEAKPLVTSGSLENAMQELLGYTLDDPSLLKQHFYYVYKNGLYHFYLEIDVQPDYQLKSHILTEEQPLSIFPIHVAISNNWVLRDGRIYFRGTQKGELEVNNEEHKLYNVISYEEEIPEFILVSLKQKLRQHQWECVTHKVKENEPLSL